MPNARVAAAAIGLPGITKVTPAMRRRMEEAVERLIAVLDALDGDSDAEPSLGYQLPGDPLDTEEEHNGCEPDTDAEPSIGWSEHEALSGEIRGSGWDSEDCEVTAPERYGAGFVHCGQDDEEDGCDQEYDRADREPSLGWSEGESLTGSITNHVPFIQGDAA